MTVLQFMLFFINKIHLFNPILLSVRYKDASKTSFKSSTRLECMMQDYPKTLPPTARVGFTVTFLFQQFKQADALEIEHSVNLSTSINCHNRLAFQ